jgi:hypothetical protein
MTTSGTYNFAPALGELVVHAYNLIGIRATSLAQEHMEAARMATNLMLSRWSNQGVNLWAVDVQTTPLVTGQSTYPVDPSTVMILDAYISRSGNGQTTDRIILPVSRTEYASYPNKTQQGNPSVFWFDRLISPTVTVWPVPNVTNAPANLKYYRVRRIQDANLAGGEQVEIPPLWLEAFADGLSYRLARVWNPAMAPALKAVADESYQIAADQNVEQAATYISPQMSGYWRV